MTVERARSGAAGRDMRQNAFTLVELLIVVALLGLVGLTTFQAPGPSTVEPRLDAAAREVAAALRFARSEALRIGEARHVKVDYATERVFAGRPELSSGEVVLDFVLIDPFSKLAYDFIVGDVPATHGVEITNVDHPFKFAGLPGQQADIVFDVDGRPFSLKGGVRHRFSTGAVLLGFGGSQRTVVVSPIGRVTVQ